MAIHPYNPGGDLTVALNNTQVTNGVNGIRTAQGRLCKVLVTTLIGANAINFFDNPSAASGTIIGTVPNGATVGTVFAFDMPYATGLSTSAAAGGGAVTISLY